MLGALRAGRRRAVYRRLDRPSYKAQGVCVMQQCTQEAKVKGPGEGEQAQPLRNAE